MTEQSGAWDCDLPLSMVRRIDEACNRFELAWQAGQRPSIEVFVKDRPEPERSTLLRQLVGLELDYRAQAGEQPQPQEYRDRFPELTDGAGHGLETTFADTGAAPYRQAWPTIPGYEVQSELGRGGMGVVYKAWQTSLNRFVALKMIRTGDLIDSRSLARFRTEAEAVARLQHPHIVQIYEAGQHEGRLYITLECVEGTTLARELSGTPWPASRAAKLMETLAQAIHHVHQQGIVHRDLTPGNVLLSQDGQPKITDFGLAKIVGGGPTLTQTGAFMGTPSYTAPEQASCKTKEVGPAVDVYALGAILYECLTGRPPFKAETALATLRQVESQEPVPPSRLQPNVPRDLSTVCLKCLQREPRKRYASAEALAEDLRRFLAGSPVRARPIGQTERLLRWCRRYPVVAALLGTVAVLLLAITTVSTFSAVRLKTELTRTAAAEREARLREADALLGQAHGIRYSRRPGQRFEALAALEKAAAIGRELRQPPEWFDKLRNEVIAALALPDIHVTQSFPGFPSGTHRVELSQDFELYAQTTEAGACSIRRVSDDVQIACLSELGEPAFAIFGPGRLLNFIGESTGAFQLWDLSGSDPVRRLEKVGVCCASFSKDGRLVLLAFRDGSISVFATDTAAPKYRLKPSGFTAFHSAFVHPTEAIVATCSYDSNLMEVRDLRNGAVVVHMRLPWGRSGMCAWSPDGHMLAVSDGDSGLVHLYAYDRTGPKLRLIQKFNGPDSSGGTTIQFSPSCDRLVIRGWGDKVHLFDVTTGRLLFSTPPLPVASFWALQFDPSGKRLAACRDAASQERIGIWSVADGREYRALFHDGPKQQLHEWELTAIHPGGRLIAQGVSDGFALFDLESGKELAFVKVPESRGQCCFDGIGNLLWNGSKGAYRWPLRRDPSKPARLIAGPPERLPLRPGDRGIATSSDGQVIAQAIFRGGGWKLGPNTKEPRRLEMDGCSIATVSPNGRWVAFDGHMENGPHVYEAATGRQAWKSPALKWGSGRFSRDGRWLLCSQDGGRSYAVDTWEPGPQLGPGIPWDASPDGLVVVGFTGGIYRLVELATGRELARLEDPDQIDEPAVFTPDGTHVVVNAQNGPRVWDLRRIRAELTKVDLDWDAPPYPEVTGGVPEPMEVQVVGVELTNPTKMAEYQRHRAILDVWTNPFDGDAQLRLGEQLLQDGQAELAYAHLTAALAFAPNLVEGHNLRGRAALRLTRWPEAVADLSNYLVHHADANEARLLRAHAYQMAGRFEDAVADCTALVQDPPLDPRLHDLRAACQDALGHAALAKADHEMALALAPHDPMYLNNLAWHLVTGPADQRDPPRALQLIREAVQQKPNDGIFLNTLGVVQYRSRQYVQAMATLEMSLNASKGSYDGFDLFFLALCHAQLEAPAKAKECFNKAVKWCDCKKDLPINQVHELRSFRVEAETVLGLK